MQVRLNDPAQMLYHTEPIVMDGKVVSYLTPGAYGHTLGAAVGLGYVPCGPGLPADELLSRRFDIEVAGKRVPATVSLKPLYDPTSERTRV